MSIALDLRSIARALDGEVAGRQVLAPRPAHSLQERSLSVLIEPSAPDGFLAHSHAGDDWRTVRDYVRDRCGFDVRRPDIKSRRPESELRQRADAELKRVALFLWARRRPITGTPAEAYL